MVGARLTSVPGASDWFAGGVVAYASEVKRALLGVGPGPVVSEQAAGEMALGVATLLGADVGLSLTGVAGPASQDDQPPGTVFIGLAGLPDDAVAGPRGARVTQLALRGQRPTVREVATTSALDFLRRALSALPA
jgi:PncC family amidohydrolase